MNVYQKLQKCRIDLQGKSLKKSGKNKFAGYEYFELGDFLPTAQQIFANNGLCPVVSFSTETASLELFNVDKPEEIIHFYSPMAEAALKGCHQIQNLGAVETYQRRYLYMTALEIVEHDALDGSKPTEAPKAQNPTQTPPKATESASAAGKTAFAADMEQGKGKNEQETKSVIALVREPEAKQSSRNKTYYVCHFEEATGDTFKASTFSETLFKQCQKAATEACPYVVSYAVSGRYRNLVNIELQRKEGDV